MGLGKEEEEEVGLEIGEEETASLRGDWGRVE